MAEQRSSEPQQPEVAGAERPTAPCFVAQPLAENAERPAKGNAHTSISGPHSALRAAAAPVQRTAHSLTSTRQPSSTTAPSQPAPHSSPSSRCAPCQRSITQPERCARLRAWRPRGRCAHPRWAGQPARPTRTLPLFHPCQPQRSPKLACLRPHQATSGEARAPGHSRGHSAHE